MLHDSADDRLDPSARGSNHGGGSLRPRIQERHIVRELCAATHHDQVSPCKIAVRLCAGTPLGTIYKPKLELPGEGSELTPGVRRSSDDDELSHHGGVTRLPKLVERTIVT